MTKHPVPQVITVRDLPLPKPADLFVDGTLLGWYTLAENLYDDLWDRAYNYDQDATADLEEWMDEAHHYYVLASKTNYQTAVQTLLVEIPTMIQLAENSQVIDWLNATYRLLEEVVKC